MHCLLHCLYRLVCLSSEPDTRVPCSEVAKFCQKYMAAEILKLQHFTEGRVSDSLIEVFHKMDLMLADRQYSEARTGALACCSPCSEGSS